MHSLSGALCVAQVEARHKAALTHAVAAEKEAARLHAAEPVRSFGSAAEEERAALCACLGGAVRVL